MGPCTLAPDCVSIQLRIFVSMEQNDFNIHFSVHYVELEKSNKNDTVYTVWLPCSLILNPQYNK